MKRRPYAVAALIAILATLATPPEFEDEASAVRWYRLAAEQGHASAQFLLGGTYANGEGLEDSVLAHMWLNIAGANGDEAARERRDNLERDMTRAEVSRAAELARVCMTSDYQDCAP